MGWDEMGWDEMQEKQGLRRQEKNGVDEGDKQMHQTGCDFSKKQLRRCHRE